MAPTCYNSMKNLHYRVHSMPEAVYANHHIDQAMHGMVDMLGHQEYLVHHAQMQTAEHKIHQSSVIKKRNALRRSQTSVCDLVLPGGYHRAPLASGVYEAFLPHPNLNAIGLPLGSSLDGSCNISRTRTRPQSFYVSSNHYRTVSASLSQHRLNFVGSQPEFHQSDYRGSPYSINQSQAVVNQRVLGMGNEPKYYSPTWYHRSVLNISKTVLPQPKSATTPLFVDCSVEYDLGDQPVIPVDSEPLLSIHPDYVASAASSSPYRVNNNTLSVTKKQRMQSNCQERKAIDFSDIVKQQGCHKSMSEIPLSHIQKKKASSQPGGVPRKSKIQKVSSNQTSPDINFNSNYKIEPTRKLSVESRDSGIGLMNSTGMISEANVNGSQWLQTQSCDTKLYSNMAEQASVSACQLTSLPNHQTEYTGQVQPINNKRFAITDLVSGLLCCSVPPSYQAPTCIGPLRGNSQQPSGGQHQGLGAQQNQIDLIDKLGAKQISNTTDNRTVEWVVQSQRMINQCRAGCCGRDCGDGFCNNVWKNMVPV